MIYKAHSDKPQSAGGGGAACLMGTPDHLLHLLGCVQYGADNHDSVQQVQGNPVWRADVLRPPDEREMSNNNKKQTVFSKTTPEAQPDQAVSPVGGEHHDGGDAALQRSMEVREAFGVQHVHFVHKQHPGYQLGDALVDVAVHHLVDLSAKLVCGDGEGGERKGQETACRNSRFVRSYL